MSALIERPEDELQHMIGRLIWENTALKYEVERLHRQIAAQQPKPEDALE